MRAQNAAISRLCERHLHEMSDLRGHKRLFEQTNFSLRE